jgi:hypothetical protein
LSPGALELLGIRLIEGRSFTENDDGTATPVALVDARLAARAWPGRSAIGQRLGVDPFVVGKPNVWATVVGVVAHVRHRSPVEDVREQVYFPQRQVVRNPSVYIVKGSGAAPLAPAIRDAVRRVDPSLPIYDVRPLSAYVDDARATRAFMMQLAVIFASVALALAAVGIYGVMAYSVALRNRDFGVRMALGARPGQVIGLVCREGAGLVLSGALAGSIAAVASAWLMRGLLYDVSPWDLATLSAAVPVLLATATVACVIPARRAISTSPVDALRSE